MGASEQVRPPLWTGQRSALNAPGPSSLLLKWSVSVATRATGRSASEAEAPRAPPSPAPRAQRDATATSQARYF